MESIPPRNIYIIKPGEDTNRGFGITVESDLKKIRQTVFEKIFHKNGQIQSYLM
jgi:hypothetical protein